MEVLTLKKIPSLFKRDYAGDRLVYNEVVPGSEWVIAGEGVATVKFDGTSCLVRNCVLYKRYDRKLTRTAHRRKKNGYRGSWSIGDFKPAPDGWKPAEDAPDKYTGHWPGWLQVGSGPDDKYHREAFGDGNLSDGTYELVGPKIQGNPYNLKKHELWRHGSEKIDAPRDFEGLKRFLAEHVIEGIVWHHPDGRMVKIKRRDFGFSWPVKKRKADNEARGQN